jgi:hypothetical protein
MAPLNIEICWRSGGFETGLATSYPANDMHDAVAFRRGDPKFVKPARSNEKAGEGRGAVLAASINGASRNVARC